MKIDFRGVLKKMFDKHLMFIQKQPFWFAALGSYFRLH